MLAYVKCGRTAMFGCLPAAILAVLLIAGKGVEGTGEVIWAVNCGGGSHVDFNGIHYQKDMLMIGQASDHGKNLGIRRVMPEDQILYQTERYHTGDFAYTTKIKADGDYVLVLKFSEVWFNEPNQKVFNVVLNDDHVVVDHLDIFSVAGLGVAHDEVVPFKVKDGMLYVKDSSSEFDGILNIQFVKLHRDNPKINAIYIMRGQLQDVPMLPPLPQMDRPPVEEEEEEDNSEDRGARSTERRRKRVSSEQRVADPYASEDPSSMMIPLIAAVGAFIPLVFCLCRL